MQIAPYLMFNGQCREAFDVYARLLGGRITFSQTHGESPAKDKVDAGWQDKIMHITLEAGACTLMGSDAPPPHYQKPAGLSVSLGVDTHAEGERIFTALADGGHVGMPFGKTFWSSGFGMVTDRFGIPWMINTAS